MPNEKLTLGATDLQRNLRLYGWLKVFNKRVYLPLTSIYLVTVGHVSIAQIGALVIIGAITSIAAGIPTGYFADRVARQTSLVAGAFLLAFAALVFVLFPSFAGGIVAVMSEALGFSFISGAGEALMHDTLAAMSRTGDYVRVMGRAQSFGLIGNIILVGVVPLTWGINHRLPFVCGFAAALLLAFVSLSMVEPPRTKPPNLTGGVYRGLVRSLREFINRRSIWIFIAFGVMSAFYVAYANFVPLVMKDLGINVSLFGLLYAASSLVGALGGWYIQHLRRLPFLAYALFDVFIGTSTMIVIGLSHSLLLASIAFLLNLGFWRLRSIMYQDNLLQRFGHHGTKATLVSSLSFFDNLNEIWMPAVFVAATSAFGFYLGFALLGAVGFVVMGALFVLGVTELDHNHKSMLQ
jgi:MFS family permease